MKYISIAFLSVVLLVTPWLMEFHPKVLGYLDAAFSYVGENFAAVLLHKPVTINELKDRYEKAPSSNSKVRILIVPGHEPNFGGTEYGNLNERDINVELALYLREFLLRNGHYEVILARDKVKWDPVFDTYFKNEWDNIITFFKNSKEDNLRGVAETGSAGKNVKVLHNAAPQNVAYRLYGINKWGNENDVDIAIHVHFNDYPRRDTSTAGKYSGFAIYVPERIYANSTTTRAIADTVFKRIAKYNPESNLPAEGDGVIEEPDLIAIGAHNTADAASMLIEYGYIYEPQIFDEKVRQTTLKDLAFQTYLGLQDFFGSGNDVSFAYDTLVLPYAWKNTMSMSESKHDDVLALQTALLLDGVYPGAGKTKNDCPRTGKFGPCTQQAVSNFQKKYGIKGEEGRVGEKTKDLLNSRYSVNKAI